MAQAQERASVVIALFLLGGCGGAGEEDRQPTEAEVKAYTAGIDRNEVEAKANAIGESRAKEQALDREHRAKVPARN